MEAKETTLTLDARNEGESVLAQIYADDVLVGDTRGELQVPLCTEELRVESSDGSWLGAIQLVETGNQLSVALSRGALQSSWTIRHPQLLIIQWSMSKWVAFGWAAQTPKWDATVMNNSIKSC